MAHATDSFDTEDDGVLDFDDYLDDDPQGPLPHIIVLSNDAELRVAVTAAARRRYVVESVQSARAARRLLDAGHQGVLITDVTALRNASAFIGRIRNKYPTVVNVIATEQSAGSDPLHPVGSDGAYRLLLKPLQPGQTRRCIDAAVQKFIEESPAAPLPQPAASRIPGWPWSGVAAGAALALIVALAALILGEGADDAVAPSAELPVGAEAESERVPATIGVDVQVERLVGRAEAALTDGRIEDAETALAQARALSAEDPRYAFLDAQLARTRQQAASDRVRELAQTGSRDELLAVVADTQFEPVREQAVGALLVLAQEDILSGRIEQAAEINDSLAELVPDASATRILGAILDREGELVLQRAMEAAEEEDFEQAGNLLRLASLTGTEGYPEAAASVAAMRSVAEERAAAPVESESEPIVAPGSGASAASVATSAPEATSEPVRESVSAPAPDAAEIVAESVSEPAAASVAEPAVESVAETAAEPVPDADAQLAALTGQIMERLAEPDAFGGPGQDPLLLLAQASEIAPESASVVAARDAVWETLEANASAAIADGDLVAATEFAAMLESAGNPASATRIRTSVKDIRRQLAMQEIRPIKEIRVLNYVAPEYPARAARRRLGGSIDLILEISPTGEVTDISVEKMQDGEPFLDAALSAVSRWRLQPRIWEGEPISQRARVHIRFDAPP